MMKMMNKMRSFFVEATTLRIAIATGSGALIAEPASAQVSQARNLGGIARNVGAQAIDFTYALKLGAAFVGAAMVVYCLYGLGWGRKNDEREWPIGRTVIIGVVGALLTSVAVITGVLNATTLGGDNSQDGLSEVNLR